MLKTCAFTLFSVKLTKILMFAPRLLRLTDTNPLFITLAPVMFLAGSCLPPSSAPQEQNGGILALLCLRLQMLSPKFN